MSGKLLPEHLSGFYADIARDFGVEMASRMYELYKGLQVVFPVRFADKEHTAEQILLEYDGKNIKKLAQKYGYTERWVREIIKKARITACTADSAGKDKEA